MKMNADYFKLIPFDQVFNEVHVPGYNPIVNIENFWKKYDINSSRDHIVAMFLGHVDDPEGMMEQPDKLQLQAYSLDLFRALVAYYLAHKHNFNMGNLDIPFLPTKKLSEEELKFRQFDYALFGKKD